MGSQSRRSATSTLREPQPKCPRCAQVIASDDAVHIRDCRVVHLDCQRPRHLSREERLLLFRYCRGHAVAKCPSCAQSLIQRHELASGLLDTRTHVCRRCGTDLTESIRHHLYGCAMLPAEVRELAQRVRDAARKLVTDEMFASLPLIAATSAAEVVEQTRPFIDAGATRIILPYVAASDDVVDEMKSFIQFWNPAITGEAGKQGDDRNAV